MMILIVICLIFGIPKGENPLAGVRGAEPLTSPRSLRLHQASSMTSGIVAAQSRVEAVKICVP